MKPFIINGIMRVDFAQPSDYHILKAATDGTILEVFFKDHIQHGKAYYIRVEQHIFEEHTGDYYINNRVYRSDENGAILSEVHDYSFIEQWASIERDFQLVNIKAPLFGHFKPAISNNIDTKSCEGVSIFSRAVDAIERADKQLSGLLREFRVKEAKQYVSVLAVDPKHASPLPYLEDDYYIKLFSEGKLGQDTFFESYSPEIYSEQFLSVLEEYKRQVEDAIGLAHGTISNPDKVTKTAEEMKQTKIRTAVLVTENQMNLQSAFEQVVYAISVWLKYPNAPGEYEVITDWDDSSWSDWDAEMRGMQEDVREGLIRPEIYIARKYGVSEREALAMMPDSEQLLKGVGVEA